MKQVSAVSDIPVDMCKYKWRVRNLSIRPFDVGERLTSPFFTTGSSYLTTWQLQLYPNGDDEDDKGNLVLYLIRNATDTSDHAVLLTFSFESYDGTFYFSTKSDRNVYKNNNDRFGFKMATLAEIKDESELLPNDTLTIVCQMQVSRLDDDIHSILDDMNNVEKYYMLETNSEAETPTSDNTLPCDFRSLYESKLFSDFTIKVGDETLDVHKAILAARSEVFSTMLQQDMKEKHTNCIEIPDFDSTVIKVMIGYIYTGQLKGVTSSEIAIQLYHAAAKYALLDMKCLCAKYIAANLSVENACDVLLLGELYDNQELFKSAKNFILLNASKVLETKNWDELLAEKLNLASELIKDIVENIRN